MGIRFILFVWLIVGIILLVMPVIDTLIKKTKSKETKSDDSDNGFFTTKGEGK